MNRVFINATNCITPLGFDVSTNIDKIFNGISGIQLHHNTDWSNNAFQASIINDHLLEEASSSIAKEVTYTRLEKMMILALMPVIKKSKIVFDSTTAIIISTTKGNISQLSALSENSNEAVDLSQMAQKIANYFGFVTTPIIVSNACVSGVLALAVAKRLIQSDAYKTVFVVSGDEVSKFVLSGFNSFQAISNEPCKPYSIHRNGVTLGESAAAVCVSTLRENALVEIIGDGAINDANHISGPSRTGEGLYRSVERAFLEANIKADEVDFINAHGTATIFNDEMEAVAFNRCGMNKVPLNSFKGYYGHTLGASGLLESVIGIESVLKGKLITSLGFDQMGLSQPLNIITCEEDKTINIFLKTASGFGGCNTAVLFRKVK